MRFHFHFLITGLAILRTAGRYSNERVAIRGSMELAKKFFLLLVMLIDFSIEWHNYSPLDGEWGEWKPWVCANPLCDARLFTRLRFCDNPKPQKGGKYCYGNGFDNKYEPCPKIGVTCPEDCQPFTYGLNCYGDCKAVCKGQDCLDRTEPVTCKIAYGEAPIINKKYIWDKDNFEMTCNASNLRYMDPKFYGYITRLKMYRKLDSRRTNDFELLGMIEALSPNGREGITTNIPTGRQWEFTHGGLKTPSVYIILSVDDATRADVGLYWCEAEISGSKTIYKSDEFNLRPLAERPLSLINKDTIGNNDSFIMRCDARSFRDVDLPETKYFARLMIYRQVNYANEEELGSVEANPGDDKHKYVNIPEGRNMEIHIGGFKGFENRNTIFITLTVKDASCRDAGFYWCGLRAPRTTKIFFSPKFKLGAKVTTIVKMNPIKVTPRWSGSSDTSYNDEGDNVTMECTYTGWRRMIAIWSLNKIYQQHNLYAQDFPPKQLRIGQDGCQAYSHRSIKTIVLDVTVLNGTDPIFFCMAVSSRGGSTQASASMQIFIHRNKFAHFRSKSHTTPQIFRKKSVQLLFLCMLMIVFKFLL